MSYTDIKTFFTDLAVANGWGLAHNTQHLEEAYSSEREWNGKLVLTLDEPRGGLQYTGSFYDVPTYGFWLLKGVAHGDWLAEDTVFDAAKTGMMTVLAAMNEQMNDGDGVLQHWDPKTVRYRKAGPLVDNLFGIYCSFSSTDALNL